jgi:hypothetical protein
MANKVGPKYKADDVKNDIVFVKEINLGVLEDLDMSIGELKNLVETLDINNIKIPLLRQILNAFILEGKLTRDSTFKEVEMATEGLISFLERSRLLEAKSTKRSLRSSHK